MPQVSFVRSDHLRTSKHLYAGELYGGDPGSNCDNWLEPGVLEAHELLVASLTGAHISEVLNTKGGDKEAAVHDMGERATALSEYLAKRNPKQTVVYIKTNWGAKNWTNVFQLPLAQPPAEIDDMFNWPLMPRGNEAAATAFAKTLQENSVSSASSRQSAHTTLLSGWLVGLFAKLLC